MATKPRPYPWFMPLACPFTRVLTGNTGGDGENLTNRAAHASPLTSGYGPYLRTAVLRPRLAKAERSGIAPRSELVS